jgi:hypothetical protein
MSDRSTIAVFITNNTVGTTDMAMKPLFRVKNGYIVFYNVMGSEQNGRIQLIDLTERVVFMHTLQDYENRIQLPNVWGVHILRVLSDNYNNNTKIFIPESY